MSEHLLLAPLLESYFRRRLTKQRNATPATLASYRDALRMLILFAAARLRKKPAALALDDLDRDLVLAFLDELEEKRNNSVAPAMPGSLRSDRSSTTSPLPILPPSALPNGS
jgi:integrase/recombinase XerD